MVISRITTVVWSGFHAISTVTPIITVKSETLIVGGSTRRRLSTFNLTLDRSMLTGSPMIRIRSCRFLIRSFIAQVHLTSTPSRTTGRIETTGCAPPVIDIPNVVRHMHLCKAYGTLLIPRWTSAFWWPLIYPNGQEPTSFVKNVLYLDPYFHAYTEDSVFTGFQSFITLALQVVSDVSRALLDFGHRTMFLMTLF